MARSTIHYTDSKTNSILKALHNKLRPAGTPVQRVEYIIELLLLRIFEVKIKRDKEFSQLRKLFESGSGNETKLFYYLQTISSEQILPVLNQVFFPFYANILHEARKVFKGNLNVKVQDQLTLIQEVFSNSNFTNNVQSGNLEDVINLIADIDEERLLNTDMLGDAIESALSETGGTREIGLFRTPDHIRQMMVGLLEPTINDTIFDPACGTGGFLFDSFEFVMESISPEGKWPGPKAHPELQAWFKEYFKEHRAPMPSLDESFQFYRSGIYGIEYLGMIRKMAAVNFYIRGLNPHNIEQGDSLAKFNNDLKNSKSIVLANPPFGAERDQKAYPNVWEEYAKESETTILFVKLMLDALKDGGKCAVVVSEGFLTWDQGSARALRKMLLEEANLQAVIGLPQGVFISKNGQGPKTSVLLFEKGKPTKNVWFYNVENDGYSKGINRTQIDGCQLVEVLDIYHKYVKHGKTPPVTKNSFSISVEWLKVLDPRQKEKIRIETRKALLEKKKIAEEKLITRLNEKLEKAKTASPKSKLAKFDKKAYEFELWKFETTWEQKIQNEIAKRIDKAHLYSFNPSSYRSNLSEEQLNEWKKIFINQQSVTNGKSLDKRYENLIKSKPEDAVKHIAEFDPENAIEADIVREYLSKIPDDELKKFPDLKRLDEIFKMGSKYPKVKLKECLIPKYDKIKKNEYKGDFDIIEKISFSDGKIHLRPERKTGMDLYKAKKGDLITSKINIHQGAVAIAENDVACSTHYQVYKINKEKINPLFLVEILRSSTFLFKLNEEKNKGIKNEQGPEFLLNQEIVLPDIPEQINLANSISYYKSLISSSNLLLKNFKPILIIEENEDLKPIGEAVLETKNGWSPKCEGGKRKVLTLSCLKNGIIDFTEIKYTSEYRKDISKFYVKDGDFFYSRGNTPELVALAGLAKNPPNEIIFPDLLTKVIFDTSKILPEFAVILFNSNLGRDYFGKVPKGSSPTMVKVSQSYMKEFKVPYLGNIQKQLEIINSFNDEIRALESISFFKKKYEKALSNLLKSIWEN